MDKRLGWRNWLARGFIALTTGSLALFFLWVAAPSNSPDNHNPARQAEMMQLTLAWGRLAPLPANAKNISVQTDGTSFTRSFRAKFTAPNEAIDRWIAASLGLREAKLEETVNGKQKYVIVPGEGAGYAEVIIDVKVNEVEIFVSWS